MARGSHSTRFAEFRLAQGTVTLFSNFTPQRGKGTKHNLVSLSLLCILNLIYETRFNLNCLFFFTIWNVFAFCFFRDWWWCCFLRVCVLDFVWLVFTVHVCTVCCGSFVWWWSFDILNLQFFFFNGAEECVTDSVESLGFRGVDESFGDTTHWFVFHSQTPPHAQINTPSCWTPIQVERRIEFNEHWKVGFD